MKLNFLFFLIKHGLKNIRKRMNIKRNLKRRTNHEKAVILNKLKKALTID